MTLDFLYLVSVGVVISTLIGSSNSLKKEDCEVTKEVLKAHVSKTERNRRSNEDEYPLETTGPRSRICITVVERFSNSLDDDTRQDPKAIENEFRKFCKNTKSKENRFCYYLGGLDESATGILGELSKPVSWSMPADKVCERLKKKDAQICDLRYDKQIDLTTVDLKKLKVRDLKKILSDWNEECDGCLEKTDFIKRIEELKPIYMRKEL